MLLDQQILATIDQRDRSNAAAMSARNRLPSTRRQQLDSEISNLELLGGTSSEYDVVFPKKLREQLAYLMNSLEGAYRKPRPEDYATYDDLKSQALAGEARLQQLMQGS